ncbi:MAG: hypothetical protein JWR88_1026, partial [Pseudonocardia sp.]|nr:hypothetical protein [Pseudonocardia sp.]
CPACGIQVYPAYGVRECSASVHDLRSAARAVDA